MINPDFVRNNPQVVKDSQTAQGESPTPVYDFTKIYYLWRNLSVGVNTLRTKQKSSAQDYYLST